MMGKKDDEASKKAAEKAGLNLRDRAKSASMRISNFINNTGQISQKNDLCNKLQKLEFIYSDFHKADAQLLLESSEIEEFENKYCETKANLQIELQNLSVNISIKRSNSCR